MRNTMRIRFVTVIILAMHIIDLVVQCPCRQLFGECYRACEHLQYIATDGRHAAVLACDGHLFIRPVGNHNLRDSRGGDPLYG